MLGHLPEYLIHPLISNNFYHAVKLELNFQSSFPNINFMQTTYVQKGILDISFDQKPNLVRIRHQTLSLTVSKFKSKPRYFQNLEFFLNFYEHFWP